MNFKTFTKYLNSPFVFQLKQPIKRLNNDKLLLNTNLKSLKPSILLLKGQLILVNNGQNLIFINSPFLNSVTDLIHANLFMSDFPLHDATRDLIMLNQSRISQQELK